MIITTMVRMPSYSVMANIKYNVIDQTSPGGDGETLIDLVSIYTAKGTKNLLLENISPSEIIRLKLLISEEEARKTVIA